MADSGYYSKVEVNLTIKRLMVERKIKNPKEELHSKISKYKITLGEAIKLLADEIQTPV